MRHRLLVSASVLMIMVLMTTIPVASQTPAAGAKAKAPTATKPYKAPRTPDGQPDLMGYWTNTTYTQLERAPNVNKEFYTPEEAAEAASRAAEREAAQTTPGTTADVHYDFTQFGLDKGQVTRAENLRTSLIIDPVDGRIPALTPEGQKRAADRQAENKARQRAQYDQVQNIPLGSRCIVSGTSVPMLPQGYLSNYQIVQGPGYVMLLQEMVHEVRIIPLDARPALPENIKQWWGASRGRWEGETLVVETANFSDRVALRGASEKLRIVERFRRTDDETVEYEFTAEDPLTWSKPWTARIPLTKESGPIFEHACHEGNYGITNTLAGVRLEEKKAAEAAAKKAGQK